MKTYREKLGYKKYHDAGISCEGDVVRTEQHHKEDCDINTIMERYERTGHLEETPRNIEDAFGDFANIPDLQTVLNTGIAAQEAFMELPAKTRARFRNNPAELWDFLHDPSNKDESVRLGLRTPEVTHSEVSVSTVTSSKANASRHDSTPKGADKKKTKTEETEE